MSHVKHIADQLGLSPSAVRKAIARGTLRATLVDGAYVVQPEDVEAYARDHARPRTRDVERVAYVVMSDAIAVGRDVDDATAEAARAYARRRRQAWPPRGGAS